MVSGWAQINTPRVTCPLGLRLEVAADHGTHGEAAVLHPILSPSPYSRDPPPRGPDPTLPGCTMRPPLSWVGLLAQMAPPPLSFLSEP